MPRLVDYIQCLHTTDQTTFQSLPSESMTTIGKQSQSILGSLEIRLGNRGCMIILKTPGRQSTLLLCWRKVELLTYLENSFCVCFWWELREINCALFSYCAIIEVPLGMAPYEALYLNESINLIIKIMCPHQVRHCNFLLLMWSFVNSSITKQGVSSASDRIVLTFQNITINTSQIQLECSSPCLLWHISGLMVYFQVKRSLQQRESSLLSMKICGLRK